MIEQEIESLEKDIDNDHQTGFFCGFAVVNVGHRRFPLTLAFILLIFILIVIAFTALFVLVDLLNNPNVFEYTRALTITGIIFVFFICIAIRYTLKKGLVQ